MHWYQILALVSATICIISCLIHGTKLIRYGKPKDYSQKSGDINAAVKYSYTGAMSPTKKESAFMHLPTYTAGLLYHMGTFLSLFVFILFITGIVPTSTIAIIFSIIIFVGGLSGLGILIKRILKEQLRALSNPDDYISNLLVTIVQFLTALSLIVPEALPFYYIMISMFFLYLPLGKLKHTVYFFAARYHLGFFYGWRGVWPPKQG